jgi:hypothetical protein
MLLSEGRINLTREAGSFGPYGAWGICVGELSPGCTRG